MVAELKEADFPGRPPSPGLRRASWWRMLPDGRIECRLCPRFCKLNPPSQKDYGATSEGQRGFCFVRQRVGDQVVLTTYGRSSGFCVDPIEKKPLNHFLPGTSVLSFGTAGCNLGCRFCQNWDISKAREWDKLADAASPDEIALAAQRLGCRSVAFTYNDPVIFAEYAIDVADACRERGIKSVAVTAGYITDDARPEFYQHMDAANVDLKAFTDAFYHRLCFAQLQPVLDTLKYLRHETNVWFEVTTLLIPGENDSDAELHRAAEWFMENLGPNVPWHFTAFHPDFKMLDKPHTSAATLIRAREIARSKGLHYVYTGNVHDRDGGSTWCPGCGELLIERDWYELGEWNLEPNSQTGLSASLGRCRSCGHEIAGVFEGERGDWGARRVPVRLGTAGLTC
jgi:pyruvate formate lyase activating enzyme